MKFLAVRIRNFRSFKKEQEFTFPEAPGLYFMQGINEAEPRLEANGAGKTSIWEAITWCIFGKTSRGLTAGDIGNWDVGKDACVELDFETDSGRRGIMQRTWKPNGWKILDPATDESFDLTLRENSDDPFRTGGQGLLLDFKPWLQCVLMAQNQPMFLDLPKSAKAELFSDVLGLDRWVDYSAKAGKKASAQEGITQSLQRDLSKVAGQISAVEANDLTKELEAWEREHRRKLDELEDDYERMLEPGVQLSDDVAAAEDAEAEARERLKKKRADPELKDRLKRKLSQLQKTLANVAADEREAQKLAGELNGIVETDGDCPTCGQPMGKQHLNQVVDKASRRTEDLKNAIVEGRRLIRSLEEDIAAMEEDLEDQEKAEREAREDLDDCVREAAQARTALNAHNKELNRLDDEIEDLKDRKNPYEAQQLRRERELERLGKEFQQLIEEVQASQYKESLYSLWVKGFKDLRLHLISEALNELEIEVNSAVAALGLVDWALKFDVDRETKGGTIQRGFSVSVWSPHNEAPVPWEAWSGGEAQRLRVATNMGLADLIRSRTGTGLALEVWDEPTQGLSPQGTQDLLECLADRARHEERQIWLVDHRAYSYGGFAGSASVIKTPSGSRIRQV